MATDETADIVVVGGGMVGLASAIALRDRGLDVVLLDPGEARARTSYGNAGVVSRGSILPMSSPALWGKLPAYLRNADRGLRLHYAHLPRIMPYTAHFLAAARASRWRRAAAALLPLTSAAYPAHERLAARAGTGDRLQRTGWIKAYRTEAAFAAAALEREILAAHGVAFDILDRAALQAVEPALVRPYARAMLLTETGSVREPGRLIEACVGSNCHKAREGLRMVADIAGDHGEPVEPRGPLARDRRDGGIRQLCHLGRRIGRRRRSERARVRHPCEQKPTLIEGDRVGADLVNPIKADRLQADQAVPDRQDRLGRDREPRAVQEVVRLRHRPHERALDRQHPEPDGA